MSVITTWIKETYPSGLSIWSMETLPWQIALPWQYGVSSTTWTKEY